ncbi:MAG: rod shape-determining protein MreD [Candidatus Mariimomonas ferrooxydans]
MVEVVWRPRGTAYGMLTGLLVDSASGFILGPNILTKALCGFFIEAIRQKMFQWNAFISAAIIGFFSLADIFLVYICLETFADLSFFNRPLRISIMQIVYTTVLSLFLYPFLNPQESGKTISSIKGRTF